jgi:hypothetical protein
MNDSNTHPFHLPTKPLSKIDAINRCAAATGSCRTAMLCADADYNGHALAAYHNDYRGYYVCDYTWAGRVVVARGSAEGVLRAAIEEFGRQGRGASLRVTVKAEDAELAANPAWWWAELSGAFQWERHGMAPAVGFLANSDTIEAYKAKLDAHFAERKAARRVAA